MTGADREMVELLPDLPSAQDIIAPRVPVTTDFVPHPACVLVRTDDDISAVSGWVFEGANRVVGTQPIWVRFHRADLSRGLLAVLHSHLPPVEADLILVGQPGMLTRSVLRALSGWAFGTVGLQRVVVRIPASNTTLQDLARRAGLRHEGSARRFFANGEDASVWAMNHADCRWLKAPRRPDPDPIPSSNVRMQ